MAESHPFDVHFYLQRRFCDPEDKERGVQPFYLESIHKFYAEHHSKWDPTTARLLEYGGGPVIYPLISAAPYIAEITFSDYAQDSLEAVTLWRDNNPKAHNWKPYIAYVMEKLEGQLHQELKVAEREAMLRNKMKYIFRGDITADFILDSTLPVELYDIISCNFCSECVAKTKEEYSLFIGKLANLLKPGGFLISLVSLEESFWYSANKQAVSHLYLTKDDVNGSYEDNGLSVRQTAYFDVPIASQNILNDCKALYFIAAQKL